jgi:hypothetical protein
MADWSWALTRNDGRRRYQRPLPFLLNEAQVQAIARTSLECGFWLALNACFPARWPLEPAGDASDEREEHLYTDIEHATGYKFVMARFASTSEQLFKAFEEQHFSTRPEGYAGPVVVWHGSSEEGVHGIIERGFDAKLSKRDLYGGGAYLSAEAFVALMYAQAGKDGLFHVVFGKAHLGNVENIPVGSPGQIDFGTHADGADVLTLRNEVCSYFCIKCENANDGQFQRRGVMSFSIDTTKLPSDFALCNMTYPAAVWEEFKKNVPGIVARKMRLQAKGEKGLVRKKLLVSAWRSSVGRRAPLPRAAKASTP